MDQLLKFGAAGLAVVAVVMILRLGLPPVIEAMRKSMGTEPQAVPIVSAPQPQMSTRAGDQPVEYWERQIGQATFLACTNTMAPLINAQTAILNELKEINIEIRNEQKLQRQAFVEMMRVQGEMSMTLATMLERMQNMYNAIERRNRSDGN